MGVASLARLFTQPLLLCSIVQQAVGDMNNPEEEDDATRVHYIREAGRVLHPHEVGGAAPTQVPGAKRFVFPNGTIKCSFLFGVALYGWFHSGNSSVVVCLDTTGGVA